MIVRFRPTPEFFRAEDELRGNDRQWEAYSAEENCVVFAGPGSGKTKVLTTRLVKALTYDILPPRKAACITYSNECVRELRRRLRRMGVTTEDAFLGTTHSFALSHIVRPFGPLVGEITADTHVADDVVMDRLFQRYANRIVGAGAGQDWRVRKDFSAYRRAYIDRDSHLFLHQEPRLAQLILAYEEALRTEHLIDFDGIVVAAHRLVRDHAFVRAGLKAKFPFIAIDEYQDLGRNLHQMVVELLNDAGINFFVVGDPDQSIYGFLGAEPALLRSLGDRADFQAVRLELNYRSRQRLIDVAEAALGEARGYRAFREGEGLIEEHEYPGGVEQQASEIVQTLVPDLLERNAAGNLGEIAVLYPDRTQGDVIAGAVTAAGMKYMRVDRGAKYPNTPLTRLVEDSVQWCAGGWKTARPMLRDIVHDWRRLAPAGLNENLTRARDRRLTRFLIGHRTDGQRLGQWLEEFQQAHLLADVDPDQPQEVNAFAQLHAEAVTGDLANATLSDFSGKAGADDVVNLITIHSAKGREFDAVIIMGLEEGILPRWPANRDEEVAEARRQFFVAVTRARNEVHLAYSGFTVDRWDRVHRNGPSRFIQEIRHRLRG